MECQLDTTENTLRATLSGQFIFTDHPKFRAIINAAEDPKIFSIRINVADVSFIDSAGLGMLLLLRDTCEKHKKSLTLSQPAGQVKKVFDISKFELLFTMEK